MSALLELRLPSLCAVCRRWDRARVCSACIGRYAPSRHRCRGCGLALAGEQTTMCLGCAARPRAALSQVQVAVDYAFPWDRLITAFKFGGRVEFAPTLAGLLRAGLDDRHGWEAAELVLPIPLGAQRLRERGYNQARELARCLVRGRALKTDPGVLHRVRETPAQATLDADERRRNLHRAFWVEHPSRVRGRRIALVDDVMTTGATAAEAARALREAGAVDVVLWAVARTPAPGQTPP